MLLCFLLLLKKFPSKQFTHYCVKCLLAKTFNGDVLMVQPVKYITSLKLATNNLGRILRTN